MEQSATWTAGRVGKSGILIKNTPAAKTWYVTCGLLALVVAIGALHGLDLLSAGLVIDIVPAVFAVVAVWSLKVARDRWGSLFNPWGLFLIAAILFNGGQILLRAVGTIVERQYAPLFSDEIYAQTLVLVSISILAFLIGGLCAGRVRTRHDVAEPGRGGERDTILLWIVGWSMVAVSVWPAAAGLVEGIRTVMAEGYFSLYSGPVETGVDALESKLAALLAPGLMFLLAGSQGRRRWGRLVSLVIIIALCVGLFFQGYRGAAVMPIMGYAWLWHRTVKPLPSALLGSGALVLLFVVFPLVKETRNLQGSERLSVESLVESYFSIENPAIAIVDEMGRSMNTVSYTLKLVPEVRDFDLGSSYVLSMLTIVPNFGNGLHPAVSGVQYGKWLTQQVNPWLASRGGGWGSHLLPKHILTLGG